MKLVGSAPPHTSSPAASAASRASCSHSSYASQSPPAKGSTPTWSVRTTFSNIPIAFVETGMPAIVSLIDAMSSTLSS